MGYLLPCTIWQETYVQVSCLWDQERDGSICNSHKPTGLLLLLSQGVWWCFKVEDPELSCPGWVWTPTSLWVHPEMIWQVKLQFLYLISNISPWHIFCFEKTKYVCFIMAVLGEKASCSDNLWKTSSNFWHFTHFLLLRLDFRCQTKEIKRDSLKQWFHSVILFFSFWPGLQQH